ncbi:Tagatose-6-phosphate kinase [Koleobacter methoxysyntrophicus]|uniref:Tagatose-6-phosphate kinase n=1 Tax=Koleobacter methoxysyntrophicus TaxID=2751313 RepID=A0A8A0RKW1_9FIRM|nr:1-phosphofructokinase [Koleobacter methoxysyntrophicus]QSQ08117.1 Tagatose-6-phosphate kinase [Koleobacter methoxysyntrophicus]
MITTVTLNPAIDKTVIVEQLKIGSLNRVKSFYMEPGGKGINVSRVIKQLGNDTLAIGFLGGDNGKYIKDFLEKNKINHDFIWVTEETRMNIKIFDEKLGVLTELNEQGYEIKPQAVDALVEKVHKAADMSSIMIFSGSIPRGIPADIYRTLIEETKRRNGRAILDAGGDFLLEGLKACPYMIKPNREEAEGILKRTIKREEDMVYAVDFFRSQGVEIVIISLGKDGAVMGCDMGIWYAPSPRINVRNTVGAGDAMVAAMACKIIEGASPELAFRFASAVAAASVEKKTNGHIDTKRIKKLYSDIHIKLIRG